MTQQAVSLTPTPEPVTIDPVQIDPVDVDPKAARAASLQDAPSLKDAFLKAVAEEFDARLAAAQADDTAPIPTVLDLDHFGNKRRALAALRRRAEALVTNILNAQTGFEADLAAGNDPVVQTWDEFVAALDGGK